MSDSNLNTDLIELEQSRVVNQGGSAYLLLKPTTRKRLQLEPGDVVDFLIDPKTKHIVIKKAS